MNIFKRFFKRSYAPSSDYWYNPVCFPTSSGIRVSEKEALKYLTVFACVSLIAGDVARLPLNLYRKREDGGKDIITDHRLYDLLHNAPNDEMTSFNWREASEGHLLLWGNHYSYIERENLTGKIKALWPIPDPGAVQVYREGGQIKYKYNVDGKEVTRTKERIFHIPGYGFNGLIGISMISLAREAIGLGLSAETFGAKYFGAGTHPSGVVSMDKDLGESEKDYLKALKDAYAGLGNAHGLLVLNNGEDYKNITVPPEDSQFLESRDHQKIEICGMYHVPPHKIAIHGQNSNYNNLEQENASYVDSCLMHWLVRWESAINQQLLTEPERRSGLFFEFLVAGLLRGDSQARAEFYNKLFQVGGMSPNEIRSKENMNPDPSPEADKKFVMLNMVPLDQASNIVLPGDELEPDVDEAQAARAFFSEDRAKVITEKRSIRMRDRITRRYLPLILDAAKAIVNRESKAIKKKASKLQARAENEVMGDFLTDFYAKFPEYIERKMGPVLRSYLQSMIDTSSDEIGADDVNFNSDVRAYIEGYAARHVESSLGQMNALLEGEMSDLVTRADEWEEKRPDKITTDESVRAGAAAFSWVVFGAGMSLTWTIRGSKTCPYCKELNGRKINSGQSFVSGGDELDPSGGEGPMRFFGIKKHPPLHQGCFPGDSSVTARDVVASSERWYDGDLIVIHTTAGKEVSCTPNHPIFTCHGWVAASEIKEGFKVGYINFSDINPTIISNSENMESFIEDVSKSFVNTSKMIAIPVPISSEDFHGDSSNSEIAIIRTDGSLLREVNSMLFKQLNEFDFQIRDRGKITFTSSGRFTEFIKSHYPAQSGPVGSFNLLLSLVRSQLFPSEDSSVTTVAGFDTIFNQVPFNDLPRNGESFGDTKDGFTSQELFDEVIGVEKDSFHGLVYNLHTKSNRFNVDSITVHNCDCYITAG